MSSEALLPVSVATPSNKQRVFIRYYTGFLIDLVVLNLFAEYWDLVSVDTFTTSLWAALLLQVLLKATIALEHKAMDLFKGKTGGWNTFRQILRRLADPVRVEVRDPRGAGPGVWEQGPF